MEFRIESDSSAVQEPNSRRDVGLVSRVPGWDSSDSIQEIRSGHTNHSIASAAEHYRIVLRANDGDVAALVGLARIATHRGMPGHAIRLYRRALRAGGESATLLNDLGRLYATANDQENATRCFRRGIDRYPESSSCYVSLAGMQSQQGRFVEAERLLRDAIAASKEPIDAELSLSTFYHERGRLAIAIDYYRELIRKNPTGAQFHAGLGRALLQNQEWQEGWEKYEYRFLTQDRPSINPAITIPMWNGESLANRHILVMAEQEIGDEIHAASWFHDLIQVARQCTFTCDPRLERTLRASFPTATFLPVAASQRGSWQPSRSDAYDYSISAVSLAKFFRHSSDSFPKSPYLVLPASARTLPSVKPLANRYPSSDRACRIGVSRCLGSEQQGRQSDSRGFIHDLTTIPNTDFYCIDFDHEHKLNPALSGYGKLPADKGIRHSTDLDSNVDLESWLTFIQSLDLVISVDNSIVHFAGAMGIETWLILTEPVDWRWPVSGETSVWYPSVRLIHKSASESWERLRHRLDHEIRVRWNINDRSTVA